ncbi:MAG: acyl-CoA dehydrogenase, partial [Alphaproteobacteria bacterium]|nr:acyl-CoA dehydrogenase [Alphaproteobacteria bacterium]
MADYAAPVRDMRFVLEELCDLDGLARLPAFPDATRDTVAQILEEAGRFAAGAIAPLNRSGDVEGAKLVDGKVQTPAGYAEAYRAFVEGGWNGMPFPTGIGGMGLPWAVATAMQEMIMAANLSWSTCPLLTFGAVEALMAHGSDVLKETYLPKLVTGEWSGTMNLTEPQAGTDLALLRTRAVPEGDHYRITGTKIFITYGEHELADNIVHLVLARLPDAPPGVRGISLFLVPKYLVNANGSRGERNDLRAVSLEHKMGLRGSPTCVMSYGDNGGAIGWLIGEENQGLRCMFTMMNNARLNVGLQGVAIGDRAYQQALAYARQRVQSVPVSGGDRSVTIINHPDVRRMLMTVRA